ncbi:GL15214 [Drosophila persimilis]|uniref:GL15214 n=1 Tax=Drosophila persimilis TaxID=7234 RepID=B4H3P3_DROPE|nr:GL15214 [Drosophila persimilis]
MEDELISCWQNNPYECAALPEQYNRFICLYSKPDPKEQNQKQSEMPKDLQQIKASQEFQPIS